MKRMIFLLSFAFTMTAFGAPVPDDDVGDVIVKCDVHDVDVLNIQMAVAVPDLASAETHAFQYAFTGMTAGTFAVDQRIQNVSTYQQPNDDVGWSIETGITHADDSTHKQIEGSAGGIPGWQ